MQMQKILFFFSLFFSFYLEKNLMNSVKTINKKLKEEIIYVEKITETEDSIKITLNTTFQRDNAKKGEEKIKEELIIEYLDTGKKHVIVQENGFIIFFNPLNEENYVSEKIKHKESFMKKLKKFLQTIEKETINYIRAENEFVIKCKFKTVELKFGHFINTKKSNITYEINELEKQFAHMKKKIITVITLLERITRLMVPNETFIGNISHYFKSGDDIDLNHYFFHSFLVPCCLVVYPEIRYEEAIEEAKKA